MAHTKLLNSRTKIDKAGKYLASPNDDSDRLEEALDVLNNWRSFHRFPLNTITVDLRLKVKRVQPEAPSPVRRLKRARSVVNKLSKESMRLTQMQDIGGCRAVLPDIRSVYEVAHLYASGRSQHKLVHVDDYISKSKDSGYRSLHLIFEFKSSAYPQYNKLLIEVQLRTEAQHAWATAVETVGAMSGQALKSSQGEKDWLDFFKLASVALESSEYAILPRPLSSSLGSIARSLAKLRRELHVDKKLTAYREALRATEKTVAKKAAYYLLVFLPEQPQLQIFSYSRHSTDQAFADYEKFERILPLYPSRRQLPLFPELENYSGAQAVLVGVESFKDLRESYPNYYLDTKVFLERLDAFIRRYRRAP